MDPNGRGILVQALPHCISGARAGESGCCHRCSSAKTGARMLIRVGLMPKSVRQHRGGSCLQLISLINCSDAPDLPFPTMCYTNRQTNVPTPLTTLKTQSQAPPVLFLPSTLSATPPPLLWQSQAAEHPQTLLVLFLRLSPELIFQKPVT